MFLSSLFLSFAHKTFSIIFFLHILLLISYFPSYDPNCQPPFELLQKAVKALTEAGEFSSRQGTIGEV